MGIRAVVKRALARRRLRFRYFGQTVFFPRASVLAHQALTEGVYEADVLGLLTRLARRGGVTVDVGANIGLHSAALLEVNRKVAVISYEPSPATFRCLERTHAASRWRDRWMLRPVALGASTGHAAFCVAALGMGAYEGFEDTGRAAIAERVQVPVATLDSDWVTLGHPELRTVKIDVEGAELAVLSGAKGLLEAMRPTVVLEWNSNNLRAYGVQPAALLQFAEDVSYELLAWPRLVPITSDALLGYLMDETETFLLMPRGV